MSKSLKRKQLTKSPHCRQNRWNRRILWKAPRQVQNRHSDSPRPGQDERCPMRHVAHHLCRCACDIPANRADVATTRCGNGSVPRRTDSGWSDCCVLCNDNLRSGDEARWNGLDAQASEGTRIPHRIRGGRQVRVVHEELEVLRRRQNHRHVFRRDNWCYRDGLENHRRVFPELSQLGASMSWPRSVDASRGGEGVRCFPQRAPSSLSGTNV